MEDPQIQDRSRRQFLKTSAMAALAPQIASSAIKPELCTLAGEMPSTHGHSCRRFSIALSSPVFRAREFEITKYGAVGDGRFDCTSALKTRLRRAARPEAAPSLCPKATSSAAPFIYEAT